jgi:hypothetical protein
MLLFLFIVIEYFIIVLLENYVKLLEISLKISLNKWNRHEVYSKIAYDYYEFLLVLWDYLIACK